ncbi:hypothetical protein BN439_2029 [Erwinia amylovora Ea644]|nr:hypothetical protein BN439_2029 [Erwinia amylovora Ea644]CCP07089.1 hypothetical protein BN440_2063 [Erwinia amylovora MR1]
MPGADRVLLMGKDEGLRIGLAPALPLSVREPGK